MDKSKEENTKSSKTTAYLEEVMAPVLTSPEERESIRQELTEHLEDLARDEMVKGAEPEEAEAKAREIFGPANKLARKLRNGSGQLNWNISISINYLILASIFNPIRIAKMFSDSIGWQGMLFGLFMLLIFVVLTSIYIKRISIRYKLFSEYCLVKTCFRTLRIDYAAIKKIGFNKDSYFGVTHAVARADNKNYVIPRGYGFLELLACICAKSPEIIIEPRLKEYLYGESGKQALNIGKYVFLIIYSAVLLCVSVNIFYLLFLDSFSNFSGYIFGTSAIFALYLFFNVFYEADSIKKVWYAISLLFIISLNISIGILSLDPSGMKYYLSFLLLLLLLMGLFEFVKNSKFRITMVLILLCSIPVIRYSSFAMHKALSLDEYEICTDLSILNASPVFHDDGFWLIGNKFTYSKSYYGEVSDMRFGLSCYGDNGEIITTKEWSPSVPDSGCGLSSDKTRLFFVTGDPLDKGKRKFGGKSKYVCVDIKETEIKVIRERYIQGQSYPALRMLNESPWSHDNSAVILAEYDSMENREKKRPNLFVWNVMEDRMVDVPLKRISMLDDLTTECLGFTWQDSESLNFVYLVPGEKADGAVNGKTIAFNPLEIIVYNWNYVSGDMVKVFSRDRQFRRFAGTKKDRIILDELNGKMSVFNVRTLTETNTTLKFRKPGRNGLLAGYETVWNKEGTSFLFWSGADPAEKGYDYLKTSLLYKYDLKNGTAEIMDTAGAGGFYFYCFDQNSRYVAYVKVDRSSSRRNAYDPVDNLCVYNLAERKRHLVAGVPRNEYKTNNYSTANVLFWTPDGQLAFPRFIRTTEEPGTPSGTNDVGLWYKTFNLDSGKK